VRPLGADLTIAKAICVAPRRFNCGDVDLLHDHHRIKHAFASSPPAAIASVRMRGVIYQDMPHLSLHQPHALSWPPLLTMALQ